MPWTSAGVLMGVILFAAGCVSGPYEAASLHRTDLRTVAVPILDNDTFVRGVEFELTDALIKEIEARTPYKVTDETRADSILIGRIRAVELDQLSKSRATGLGEEVLVGVTIDFQWRDIRTESLLVERKSFSGHGLFVPSAPSGERIELGQMAVVQKLARDVVDEMRSSW
jgi:hypothetical protein